MTGEQGNSSFLIKKIKQITIIIINPEFFQEIDVFLTEGPFFMVVLLIGNVFTYIANLGMAIGKSSVSNLPVKRTS
jgi:hypothetical protein